MQFDEINLLTATLDEIKQMELGHVAYQLLEVAETKRLCSIVGREILAEYKFKGNFDEVVRQLNEYSLKVESTKFTENDRSEIIARKLRLMLHRDLSYLDVQHQAITEAVSMQDHDKVIDLACQTYMLSTIAHDQKMCECFTN